mmetsp:Transcript_23148/g.72537  ORF Transcript_23148/g.72537 Transcript_23148/m.72537 type:complete len:211 (-) Transcript_23148:239-871(-)
MRLVERGLELAELGGGLEPLLEEREAAKDDGRRDDEGRVGVADGAVDAPVEDNDKAERDGGGGAKGVGEDVDERGAHVDEGGVLLGLVLLEAAESEGGERQSVDDEADEAEDEDDAGFQLVLHVPREDRLEGARQAPGGDAVQDHDRQPAARERSSSQDQLVVRLVSARGALGHQVPHVADCVHQHRGAVHQERVAVSDEGRHELKRRDQ